MTTTYQRQFQARVRALYDLAHHPSPSPADSSPIVDFLAVNLPLLGICQTCYPSVCHHDHAAAEATS